jgi:hypothetical protein
VGRERHSKIPGIAGLVRRRVEIADAAVGSRRSRRRKAVRGEQHGAREEEEETTTQGGRKNRVNAWLAAS